MRRTAPAGLTLIELLVTIAIVAVLALVVVPSFMRMVANMRLQGAGNELVSDLQFARTEAVSHGVSAQLITRNDGLGYDIVVGVAAPTPPPLKQVSLPAGVTVTPAIAVVFDPMRAMTSDTLLRLANASGTQVQLSVVQSGQVQACSPDGALTAFSRCPS